MELTKKFDDLLKINLNKLIIDENERTLQKLIGSKNHFLNIPTHVVKMKILTETDTNSASIKKVIIPAINIYIRRSSIRDDFVFKNNIGYLVELNNQPFPLAHVFSSTGLVCLGDIFVPNEISIYNLQVPLETLFLYNDRYLPHGEPEFLFNKKKTIPKIIDYLKENQIDFNYNLLNKDWLKYDILWQLSNFVYEKLDYEQAIEVMEDIFKMVFPAKTKQK